MAYVVLAIALLVGAPFIGVVAACVIAFVVIMVCEWRRISRKYPLDRLP
jgi:uncharacterized membrane protein YcjF (UPF0283 family)